ncbi:hypothetical protein G9X43_07865 [Cronobacter turicensis]|uniref:hypothetical protein n=1 Tax=Cronobacter turicensis TaxID=413502 RepID=UPI0014136069|nr:hypothetical protein [Cronobacter turicensis]NHV08299.1 hypothetical protein [Cronobacter turicensis]NHV62815.1 hypothetical protein [Cronobacter turicensis]NHW09756.1 hypothetical protein [Cronobacter turicensis]
MTAEYEYAERFADLMEDMQGDGVDVMNILMNYLMGFVEQMSEGEEDKGLVWQMEDKELVITIEPVDSTNTARLH